MDKNDILKWTAKIMFIIVLVIIINKLSDKYGDVRVMLYGFAIAALLFSIGKLLMKNK